ncbi:hypothetical protein [Larsenimonas salina]|uniref:hypothetical protein n=1 Tax=Larsenimonas salina TaxID=1295565 RepID=UPI002073DCB6|nr:hypothetical protein [Larsenimonas salina]MCM5705502.1 hypothetical protein [Larsenimonas salina]
MAPAQTVQTHHDDEGEKGVFDRLRAVAISSQALGFIMIIAFETWLPPGQVRPAQAMVLALMLFAALGVALARRYRRNRRLKGREE